MECNKTFFVTESDYKRQREEYQRDFDSETVRMMRYGIAYNVPFFLNGHRKWIYREDGDYSKDKVEVVEQ